MSKTEQNKPRLFPEYFEIGKISGAPCDFSKGKPTIPRGGEDPLEIWYSEDPEESEYLQPEFKKNIDIRIQRLKEEGWNPEKQTFLAVTQSHLDLGWMWQFRQGVAKAEYTFEKLHRHFQFFSPFLFTGSQPAMYNWVKYNSPEVWKNVVEDVKSGRHELQGGSWSECDGRMPSGEALVRQRLYGQLFYAKNFGKLATIEWFPDSFGYSSNMPQIFAKGGVTGFMTQKLTSNKQTKWPFWAWWWEAPDGSRVISYLTGNHNKLGPLGGYDVPQGDSPVKESYVKSYRLLKPGTQLNANYETNEPENSENVSDEELPFIGCFFGEGDGGHGPQGVEVAVYRAFAERGYVQWRSTQQIFEELSKFADRLPVWKDELYYQYHKGSLTSQARMKRMNRYYEWTLPKLEGLCTIAKILDPNALGPESILHRFYTGPKDQIQTADNAIEQLWQNCCLMQFHDVLPGTSLPEVYDECYEFWHQDLRLIQNLQDEALNAINTSILIQMDRKNIMNSFKSGIPFTVVNSTGARGTSLVEIPASKLDGIVPVAIFDGSKLIPIQFVQADQWGFELDLKPDRYIFPLHMNEWEIKSAWLFTSPKSAPLPQNFLDFLSNSMGNQEKPSPYKIIEEQGSIRMVGPTLELVFSKTKGALEQIIYERKTMLSREIKLQSFVDKPDKEFSWNLMPNWWDHPKNDFNTPATLDVKEEGPIKWTVRISRKFGEKSDSWIEYSIIRDIPGIYIEIGLDFRETETLVKFEVPLSLNTEYTIAEGPYCTDKRKNTPTANHDIPRWEKWMHTFVASEDQEKQIGVAIINEGKYGFDTHNNCIGISVVRGPQYVGVNVVAWVKETRKKMEQMGLGQPPTHIDQGKHLVRLCILPYKGSIREGKIHDAAHRFNAPLIACLNKYVIKQWNVKGIPTDLDIMAKEYENIASANLERLQILSCSPPSLEITVCKPAESLPECMLSVESSTINQSTMQPIVLRIVNNSNEPQTGEILLNGTLFEKYSKIIETDLLERPVANGLHVDIVKAQEANIIIRNIRFKPHEILSFKIL